MFETIFRSFLFFRCRGCGFALRGLQEGLQSCLAANCTLPSKKGSLEGPNRKPMGPGNLCGGVAVESLKQIGPRFQCCHLFGDDKGSRKNAACLKKKPTPKSPSPLFWKCSEMVTVYFHEFPFDFLLEKIIHTWTLGDFCRPAKAAGGGSAELRGKMVTREGFRWQFIGILKAFLCHFADP